MKAGSWPTPSHRTAMPRSLPLTGAAVRPEVVAGGMATATHRFSSSGESFCSVRFAGVTVARTSYFRLHGNGASNAKSTWLLAPPTDCGFTADVAEHASLG